MQSVTDFIPADQRQRKPLTDEDILVFEQGIADSYNRSNGSLDSADGYNCIKCSNRGDFMLVYKDHNDYIGTTMIPCSCIEKRKAYSRGKGSGIPEGCTLDRFKVEEEWQQQMLQGARAYIDNGIREGAWLFIGGSVGCGKTHLASGIARSMLYDMNCVFMNWVRDARDLKACVNDYEYPLRINRYINADLLIIDDLWKHSSKPTDADVRLAYDILNERYTERRPTIITSEWTAEGIYGIDQAIGSRISQMCGEYTICISGEKDMRMRYMRE